MNIALITAAGQGTRMGFDTPKQFLHIDDCPVVVYTLLAFQQHIEIDIIAVVCLQGWETKLQEYANKFGISKLKYIFKGGETNQDSIHNGLVGLQQNGIQDSDIVLIQDGVRPLVSQKIISENITAAKKFGYAVTGLPCKEVIMKYQIDNNTVTYLPLPREQLIRTQTPHTYLFGKIMNIYNQAYKQGLQKAASCELTAYMNVNEQHLIYGTEQNGLKLTNFEDIELFKALLYVSKTNTKNDITK